MRVEEKDAITANVTDKIIINLGNNDSNDIYNSVGESDNGRECGNVWAYDFVSYSTVEWTDFWDKAQHRPTQCMHPSLPP
jgi:hypothetical protein